MTTRRQALGMLSAASTLPLLSRADAAPRLSRKRYDGLLVIDAKCSLKSDPSPPGAGFTPDLLAAARESGLTLISQTHGGSGTMQELEASVARTDANISEHPDELIHILSTADLQQAKRSGRFGIAYDVQGTNELAGDASRVARLKELGIRTVQLTYNLHTAAGDGCMVPNDGGITPFGRDVIAEVNRLRLQIDFSHVGHRTAADGVAVSTRPPAITHTGCYDLTRHPRNIPDTLLRAVADKGGVVGIYFMCYLVEKGQEHKEDVLRHLEHAIQVCGEDHVGIGTDGIVPALVLDEAYRHYWRVEVYEPRVKRGVVAPNEGADIFNYAPEYNPPDRYRLLGEDLLQRGHSRARVEKILGGNFARLFSETWG